MELMSVLLLYECLATLPQTLGLTYNISNKLVNTEIRFNKSIFIDNTRPGRGPQILNVNGPPLVDAVTELQAVFRDHHCKHCVLCMERAMKAQKTRSHILHNRHSDDLYYDMKRENSNAKHSQHKRNTDLVYFKNNTETLKSTHVKLKSASPTNVTITKYTNEGGKIYAIKVNETNNDKPKKNIASTTCQVYSVKQTLPCESGESDLILAKRKVNKKGRKPKEKITIENPTTPITTVFKKREVHVDRSYVPESFMPSIEEFY